MKRRTSISNKLLWVLLAGLIAYISFNLSSEASLLRRHQLMGYVTLLACAVYATALPNALIPDQRLSTHQLLNTPAHALQKKQLGRWQLWMIMVSIPVGTLAFADLQNPFNDLYPKLTLAASFLLIIAGMGLYSFRAYFLVGPISQQWQEGTKGQWWDKLKSVNPALEIGSPRGFIPVLSATTRVFGISAITVLLTMYLGGTLGYLHGIWPGALIFGWSLIATLRDRRLFDRHYYHTNAFFGEIMRSGSFSSTVKETTHFDALYWVPSRWRPHVWASLVQLERAIPLGRFIALAILLLWILSSQDVSPAVFTASLMVFVVAKNLAILAFTRNDLAPPLFSHSMQSRFDHSITRGFVNLKWTLPLIIGLLPIGWLDSEFTFTLVWKWALIDVLCAFLFAMGVTYGTAYRTRNAF